MGSKRKEYPAVYVWRESVGYEQWGCYVEQEDGTEQLVTSLNPSQTYKVKAIPNAVFSADDDYPGANVPFALDFVRDYDTIEEGRNAIFIWRDWHRHIEYNLNHVDRQVKLFEEMTDDNTGKTVIALGQPAWNDDNIPVEINPFMYRASLGLPDKAERQNIIRWLTQIQFETAGDFPMLLELTDEDVENVADATGGLTRAQAVNAVLCL